jgi:mannose-1-phosphate guanylyltransferase/phosphomannomutase
MAGLNAAGVNVEDLEVATLPVTRFVIRRPSITGGIAIGLDPDDPQSVRIRFFDTAGVDLTEAAQRKIERLFSREDFRRVFPAEIGDIGFVPRALEHYATAVENHVDVEGIGSKHYKLVIDYGYGAASFVMPNVLSKLGLEALVVNPFVSTAGVLALDVDAQARAVADLVRASGSTLGAVIEPGGERFRLVDDSGHILSHTETLLATLVLLDGTLRGDAVALPVSTTDRAVEMVRAHGYRVVPTELSTSALMDAATEEGVGFAADQDGGIIFPAFLPAFDAAATIVRLLDLLSHHDRPLSDVVAGLPRVHVVHEVVVTPWEQKGVVMRTLVEQSKDRDIDLVDGVKVRHGDGWVLAFPDPEEPVTHLWAEGPSDAAARQLVQEYVRRVRQLVR